MGVVCSILCMVAAYIPGVFSIILSLGVRGWLLHWVSATAEVGYSATAANLRPKLGAKMRLTAVDDTTLVWWSLKYLESSQTLNIPHFLLPEKWVKNILKQRTTCKSSPKTRQIHALRVNAVRLHHLSWSALLTAPIRALVYTDCTGVYAMQVYSNKANTFSRRYKTQSFKLTRRFHAYYKSPPI